MDDNNLLNGEGYLQLKKLLGYLVKYEQLSESKSLSVDEGGVLEEYLDYSKSYVFSRGY